MGSACELFRLLIQMEILLSALMDLKTCVDNSVYAEHIHGIQHLFSTIKLDVQAEYLVRLH